MEFSKDGNMIFLFKKKYESNEIFMKKGWFIISQPNLSENYDNILKLSEIYINIKFLNCIYDSKIMFKINEMEKYM